MSNEPTGRVAAHTSAGAGYFAACQSMRVSIGCDRAHALELGKMEEENRIWSYDAPLTLMLTLCCSTN